jgi:F-type H+-transporting ATPase subunit b
VERTVGGMATIFEQLGLNQTFFVQFVIFLVVFLILGNLYFKPFLHLFEARHKRTVEDRDAAEKLMAQANSRFEEYRRRLAEERATARKELEAVLAEVKKEEATLLGTARSEAKKITQEALENVQKQRTVVQKQLEKDVDQLAQTLADTLLGTKK